MAAKHIFVRVSFVMSVCFIFIMVLTPVKSQTLDQNIQLMTDNLNGYDRRFRPILNQSQPINVNVTFNLISLQDLDEVGEKFSVTGIIYLKWFDEKLTWNPAAYGGLGSQTFSIGDIWYPILVLTNPSKAVKDVAQSWMTIRVYFNGYAIFSPASIFEATCSIDVTYFPFDIQTCRLHFIPWGMEVDEMLLRSTQTTVDSSYFKEDGEWTFDEMTASDALNASNNEAVFTFKMRRKPTFLIVSVVLPIIFMAVINVFVFVLPAESGERISFSITVLLALAVFLTMITDNLPKTSNPLSHLSYFLTIILVYSVIMSITAVSNLRIYFKDDHCSVPRYLATAIQFLRCERRSARRPGKSSIRPHPGHVGLAEMDLTEKPAIVDTDDIHGAPEREPSVTWKDVSATVDVLCLIGFSLAILITTVTYLIILTSNA